MKGMFNMKVKKLELSQFAIKMKELAALCQLEHDGQGDDNRLFSETMFCDTLSLSKSEYSEMEKLLDKTKVKGKGFNVSAWNDCSGYEYWTKKQEENNYIQVTVYIDDPFKVDAQELRDAVNKVENIFWNYRKD